MPRKPKPPQRFVPREQLAAAAMTAPRVYADQFRQDVESALASGVQSMGSAYSETREVLEAARRRGDALRAQLVATGKLLPAKEFMSTLGIPRRALERAMQARTLFAVEHAGERFYPAFFADPTLDRRRLGRVAQVIGAMSSIEKWLFFNTPKASLDRRTPLEAIRAGDYKHVRLAAAAHAER